MNKLAVLAVAILGIKGVNYWAVANWGPAIGCECMDQSRIVWF
jgi:hypothetical protein